MAKKIKIADLDKRDIHPTIIWRPGHNDYIVEVSDKPYRRTSIGTFNTYAECEKSIISFVEKLAND